MARLGDKPGEFRPGGMQVSAGALNKMVRGQTRQITGSKPISVHTFNDRVVVSVNDESIKDFKLIRAFVVREESSDGDLLLCAPLNTGIWVAGDGTDQATIGKIVGGIPGIIGGGLGTIVNGFLEPPYYDVNLGNNVNPNQLYYVAKPWLLQKTPFNGRSIYWGNNVPQSEHLFTYTTLGVRQLTNSVTNEVTTEYMTPRYFPGEIIIAKRLVTGYYDPMLLGEKVEIVWQDINEGGRNWQPEQAEAESISIKSSDGTIIVRYNAATRTYDLSAVCCQDPDVTCCPEGELPAQACGVVTGTGCPGIDGQPIQFNLWPGSGEYNGFYPFGSPPEGHVGIWPSSGAWHIIARCGNEGWKLWTRFGSGAYLELPNIGNVISCDPLHVVWEDVTLTGSEGTDVSAWLCDGNFVPPFTLTLTAGACDGSGDGSDGGTGHGEDDGGPIDSTGLGTDQGKNTDTLTIADVQLAEGELLIVITGYKGHADVPTVQIGGNTLSSTGAGGTLGDPTTGYPTIRIWTYLATSDIAGDITATWANPNAAVVMTAIKVSGVTTLLSHNMGIGTDTNAFVGTNSTITDGCYIQGYVMTIGPVEDEDGSWATNFIEGNQDVGTTGGTAIDNLRLCEGFRITIDTINIGTSIGKSGITSRTSMVGYLAFA